MLKYFIIYVKLFTENWIQYTVFTNYFFCKENENVMKCKDFLPIKARREAWTKQSGNFCSTIFCKEL